MALRRRCFLVKINVKTKELGPVGGGRTPGNFVCRSANVLVQLLCALYGNEWCLKTPMKRSISGPP